jgi:hypothetical protein
MPVNLNMKFLSGWIDDKDIKLYHECKEQMMKLGKPKASFQKAITEIEAHMNDPNVSLRSASSTTNLSQLQIRLQSEIITTPARQVSKPKVRKSTVSENGNFDGNESSIAESGDDKTPAKSPPVAVTKRPTVRSTLKIKAFVQVTFSILLKLSSCMTQP